MSRDLSVTRRKGDSDDAGVWAWWVVGGLAAWLLIGTAVAVLLGSMIRLADRREGIGQAYPAQAVHPVARRAAVSRRRPVPLAPVGVGLVGIATALMVIGYLVRVSGHSGPLAQLLSMDAPLSIPRMFIVAIFAVAALAAIAGAGAIPGRRTWWTAVGLVAAGIAAVKAGGSVHTTAMAGLNSALTPAGGVLVSAVLAVSVVSGLWFLSRTERRDRLRVLSVLALYGVASVGLSAISSVAAATYGGDSALTAAATLVEETGESLAGVMFLMAVLVGVAPRLVLPTDWVLRREADAHTLELPEGLPARSPIQDGAAG